MIKKIIKNIFKKIQEELIINMTNKNGKSNKDQPKSHSNLCAVKN